MVRAIEVAGLAVAAVIAAMGAAVGQEGRIASFEMAWPTRTNDAIARLAQAAAEVVTGQPVKSPAVAATRLKSSSGRLRVTVPEAPALEIIYLPDVGELRVVDTELATSTAPEREMAQDEAVKLAKTVFDELSRRQVLDARQYDWAKADVASTVVGTGSLDGRTIDRKRVEYRITVRRVINGIELANAGLRIAIHASGRVAGLRFGGVTVASRMAGNVEEPTGTGRWQERRVQNDALQARFERDVVPRDAKARTAWSRVMYVMPENARRSVVQPLYVVSYSIEVPSDDGQAAVSRRKTVGLSLTDANARPIDLTPPLRPPQTERERKPER